jgi:hypothetical protein
MNANIVGYSLKHYAIVSFPDSKSKKGTKKAKETAIEAVRNENSSRLILGATFHGTTELTGETWVVEYVRPNVNNQPVHEG